MRDPRKEQMQRIAESVALRMGVNPDLIVATRAQRGRRYRSPVVVLARHVVMWLVRRILQAPFHEIARFLHCDHSTVVYACQKIDSGDVSAAGAAAIDAELFGEHPRWASA